MTPNYWVEMTLEASGDWMTVDELVSIVEKRHDGQVTYTFSHADRRLTLAMASASDEHIESVSAQAVGTVRSVAHELGYRTPGWPEPVTFDDVRIKVLDTATAGC